MFPFNLSYFILFMAFSTVYISTCTFAAPLSNAPNPYDSFIKYLVKSNCSMPVVVKLPFPETSDDAPFSYLSTPLGECQTPDALKDSDEAKTLCSEIFEVLENITCSEYKTPLPEIQTGLLSEDVCKDFKMKQIDFPRKNDYLSWRLVDPVLCKFLCAPGKYDSLCETLLWSHDLQIKIKSALKSTTEGDNYLNKSVVGVDKKNSSSIKINLVTNVTKDSLQQKNNDNEAGAGIDGNVQPSGDITTTKKEASKVSLEIGSSNAMTSVTLDSSTVNNKKGNVSMVINTTEAPTGKKGLKPTKEDVQAGKSNENLQGNPENQEQNELQAGMEISTNKNDNDNSVNSHPDTVVVDASNVLPEGEEAQNSVAENQQPLAGSEEAVINPSSGNNIDNLATKVSENKNEESNPEKNVEDKQKTKSNATTKSNGADVNAQSNENAVPQDTENELNNVNLEVQENELKVKEPNLKTTDDGKKTEKPALTDFESPIGLGSEAEVKPTESTTLELLPDKEEEEHQVEKDPDQYNDNENEEYPKSDYENSFDPSLKSKEVDNKSPDLEGPNPIVNNYDPFIRSRNNIGRIPDGGPVISAFPDQEDSHFFFYFLSIVLILMAGYLIFHNKQKIIALIVEGRHERRRRSHGSGYKKLETK